jgi:hypothetical protein
MNSTIFNDILLSSKYVCIQNHMWMFNICCICNKMLSNQNLPFFIAFYHLIVIYTLFSFTDSPCFIKDVCSVLFKGSPSLSVNCFFSQSLLYSIKNYTFWYIRLGGIAETTRQIKSSLINPFLVRMEEMSLCLFWFLCLLIGYFHEFLIEVTFMESYKVLPPVTDTWCIGSYMVSECSFEHFMLTYIYKPPNYVIMNVFSRTIAHGFHVSLPNMKRLIFWVSLDLVWNIKYLWLEIVKLQMNRTNCHRQVHKAVKLYDKSLIGRKNQSLKSDYSFVVSSFKSWF